jgi:tRNA A37 methylthiotransferase MiaB
MHLSFLPQWRGDIVRVRVTGGTLAFRPRLLRAIPVMSTVSFAELTHTGVAVDANNIPLAVGYIAAYAKTHLGEAIDAHLFKYPAALSKFLKHQTPTIACFSNYMWNGQLSCTFAREIKRRHPNTIVVMGGPNYPVDVPEQQKYLEQRPEIDFFIDGEGEMAFVALFKALEQVDFDAPRLKASGTLLPSVHYLSGGEFVRGELLPRILELDQHLPSPYTMGLLDEFFDDKLTPMIQTARGCPYSCTFCHDGIPYMNKTRAFSQARVREELSYIAARVKTATLQMADLNWGMFPSDLQTAQFLADIRDRTRWPRNIMTATAKNQKDRIVEMSRILGDLLQLGASIQSTDAEVLHAIKRTNISLDAIVKMAKNATASKTGSFTEIILGLPTDTGVKHRKSVFDMLDAGIQDIRSFQFILLPGTEASDTASRERFQYDTGFRVLARCFGRYDIYGEDTSAAEIQEIVLGNNTMPRDEYFECRAFDLTTAIFNNGGILKEFFRLGETLGIPKSKVMGRIHQLARAATGSLAEIYAEFRVGEGRNFFERRDDLEEFLSRPDTMDAYLRGDYGVNHIYKARTTALLTFFDQIAAIAREAVSAELADHGLMDATLELYLDELLQVAVARKSRLTDLEYSASLTLHFDFTALHRQDFLADPRDHFIAEGFAFTVQHSDAQKTDLRKYFTQYGRTVEGIGQFLQRNDSHLSAVLYRGIDYAEPFEGVEIPSAELLPVGALSSPESPSAVMAGPAAENTFPLTPAVRGDAPTSRSWPLHAAGQRPGSIQA